MRASEFCNLKMSQLDMDDSRYTVLGKGNKKRQRRYLADAPVFLGKRGTNSGEGLHPNGLLQLIQRLGHAAGLQAVRCSPHTIRNTFAIEFLRTSTNQFTLKEMLGHTTLDMTGKYVALAQSDIQNQHRLHSPGDKLAHGNER